ncbi:hypothetical protein BDA96_03G150900 [Sorghum bicolor]|uniref:Uncharacterized protein n=2 Tax=Sorghum bicolor TaxID=4558 RepID=A0A921RCY7_SORBI|nr:hypothetical protein BDA96_03G150900 [Sorghum bicolor]KXG32362.1 hypothetical protein SORBI_3003G143500 [Sorghum bicolor]
MGCPRPREGYAVAIVFMALLFLLSRQAGVVVKPTVAVKHQAVHVRRLLNNDARAGGGNSRGGAAAVTFAASVDLCSEEVVEVSQGNAGSLPNGVPSYSVTITNTCLDCTVRDVHVSCGEFATTELVDPSYFRRLSYGDCLVRNGGPIGPGEIISFDYSNSFIYKMEVATVSCVNI